MPSIPSGVRVPVRALVTTSEQQTHGTLIVVATANQVAALMSTVTSTMTATDTSTVTVTFTTTTIRRILGDYLKSIVYGGLDGIITTFSTVTSVSGARLHPVVIVVLGISHLFSDGLSMATGDAMSSQAEIDYQREERRREAWELNNDRQGEINEMIQILEKKGVATGDAQTVITTLAKYDDAFLDLMLNEELGIPKQEENAPPPYKSGLVTMLLLHVLRRRSSAAVPHLAHSVSQNVGRSATLQCHHRHRTHAIHLGLRQGAGRSGLGQLVV